MSKKGISLSFKELVSSFPKDLSYRVFEYIFLSSSRVTNLTEYEQFKEQELDFECNLTEKLKRKLSDTNYPIQRIIRCTFFNNRKLQLLQGVFDPRPETELLIQVTKELVQEIGLSFFSYLDLCSGTGAIYLSVLLELGDEISRSAGVDSSVRACQNTLENLYELGVSGPHRVILSSWQSFLVRQSQWEVITMNPPYLAIEEWNQSLRHDPKSSLVASQKGLTHYQKLLDYLQKNTYWKLVVLECSEFHESYWEEVESLNASWDLRRYKDYLGKFRAVSIARK